MRRLIFISFLSLIFSQVAQATWQKINDVDYVWGPFKIYNISLFSETGQYIENMRPLMLTLKYAKPVDGRDFAISLARSWSNLGITLKDQDDVVDRLRKILPNIKKDDVLSYIALDDKGYFVLNDTVIPEEFNKEFSDAVVSIWLDPRVEIGRKLIQQKEQDKTFVVNTPQVVNSTEKNEQSVDNLESKTSEKTNENVSKDSVPENTEKPIDKKEETQDDSEIEIIPASDPIPEKAQPAI
ncbi:MULTISPECIES: pyruvate formate lyase-activating protein [Glaesserella]|uniref:Pyruvate formate lyase-activating protein n=1 Tax=Glaesserella australis TaxID=2094024 RepID=A0A328C2C7_9PAST|nr:MULTISPECIES: pyruvate formate lyase-activating protein [Glaesserella]AUI66188.1 pyruvate formate lyase-activating protein [Glaesserella sp. 15-184]RAL19210.1 pyruvate formate lyase-activating protein [Glaesserella australis]